MARPHLSIRAKLILSISIPLLLTYLGLLAWDYQHQRDLAISDLKAFLQQRAEGVAGQLDARLTSVTQLSRLAVTPLETEHGDLRIRTAAVGAMRNPWVVGLTVAFDDGDGAVAKSAVSAAEDFRNRDVRISSVPTPDWFAKAVKQSASGWTSAHTVEGPAGPRRVVTYYAPVRSNEQPIGAVGLDVSLDALRRAGPSFRGRPGADTQRSAVLGSAPADLPEFDHPPEAPPGEGRRSDRATNRPARGEGGRTFEDILLFDSNGDLLAAPPADSSQKVGESLQADAKLLDQPALLSAADAARGGEAQVLEIDNLARAMPSVGVESRHWLALAPMRNSGWIVAVAMGESGRTAEVIDRLWQRAIYLSIGSLVMLGVVWVVAVRISRPIEQLARGVDEVAAGDLAASVPEPRSDDELARLARGFNRMTGQIRQHVAQIRATAAAHERVESELRVARQIQLDLLPKTFPPFPDRTEFDLYALNLSALHVAGDFYDFFFVPGGQLMLVIADVSGKGVPAALLMAVTRTLVRNLAISGGSPAQIMTATNRALVADSPGTMFVTMLLCQYDPAVGKLTYVNAGHPPALLLSPGQSPRPVCDDHSSILGVDDSGALGDFVQHEVQLQPGETLLLYTDGASEAPTDRDGVLGTHGLIDLLRGRPAETPDALCLSLAESLRRQHGRTLGDDITLLALRRQ